MTTMPDWLGRRAVTHRDEPAIGGVGALRFAELDARVSAAARRLGNIARAGDRIALLAANGIPFIVHAHAIGRLGATLVAVNARLAAVEIARQLADAGVTLLLHDVDHAERAAEATAGTPVTPRVIDAFGIAEPERDVPLRATIDLDEPHSVMYTSGTTGRAKGAVLTWGNFWWSAVGSALNVGHARNDAWLVPLPLFHVGGLSVLTRSVIGGICAVVHDGFDPLRVNAAIDEGATIVSVVAVMLERMLEARGDRSYPDHLRCVLLGGGPASRALLERCIAARVPVALSYGLTESTSQAATLPPERALAKLGSSGQPLLPTEIRIECDGVAVAAETDGEIVLRGPTIVRQYLNAPETTAQAWRGGWFHTGDIGRIDREGYLYVLDRRDDLIISGGENVYPAEIEGVLNEHPAVVEAGVTGADDARWGRVPIAYVRLADGATIDSAALIAFSTGRLARYKVPRRIVIVREPLPRNAAGKLLRKNLQPLSNGAIAPPDCWEPRPW